MRVVRGWEDAMLTREIAECRQVMDEHREKGTPPSTGLAMYEMGLRTAAVMLGTEPEHWRRKPWVVRMWRRWIRGRG